MNPNIQAQIFDVSRGQFAQVDGGQLSTAAILFQILVELRVQTYLLTELSAGRVPADDPAQLRSDMLLDQSFVQFK